jgi:hypothetical protein
VLRDRRPGHELTEARLVREFEARARVRLLRLVDDPLARDDEAHRGGLHAPLEREAIEAAGGKIRRKQLGKDLEVHYSEHQIDRTLTRLEAADRVRRRKVGRSIEFRTVKGKEIAA